MLEVVEEVLEQQDMEVMEEKVAVVTEEVLSKPLGLLQQANQERLILEVVAVEQHLLPQVVHHNSVVVLEVQES
jgi:hypothetical protein